VSGEFLFKNTLKKIKKSGFKFVVKQRLRNDWNRKSGGKKLAKTA
jgi:hypothetical protein